MWFFVAVAWALSGAAPAWVYDWRHQDFRGHLVWMLLSVLLGPIAAGLILVEFLLEWKDRKKRPSSSPSPSPSSSPNPDQWPTPYQSRPSQSQPLSQPSLTLPHFPSLRARDAWLATPVGQAWLRQGNVSTGTWNPAATPGTSTWTTNPAVTPGTSTWTWTSTMYDWNTPSVPPRPFSPAPLRRQEPKPKQGYVWGYRVWKLHYGMGVKHWDVTGKTVQPIGQITLTPFGMETAPPWQPGVNVATCHSLRLGDPDVHAGMVPAEGCMCGFWCLRSIEAAIKKVAPMETLLESSNFVIGSVVGMGKAVRHSDGWRSEKAMVVAFLDPFVKLDAANIVSASEGPLREQAEVLKALSERWDVPLIGQNQIEAFTESVVKQMWGLNDDSNDWGLNNGSNG